MPRIIVSKFKTVSNHQKMWALDDMFEKESDFCACEEILYLNESLGEAEKIQNELHSTMNYLKKLTAKYGSTDDICTVTPGTSWTQFPCNDPLINEQRQKHDLNLPQQHHKVQEINDGSSSSVSSTASNIRIINHLTEVNKDSEFNVDEGAGGDGKSFNRQTESNRQADYVLSSPTFDFLKRHRFKVELIKIKNDIQSAIQEVRNTGNKVKEQTLRTDNYLFKMESARNQTPTKCVKFYRRNFSTSVRFHSPRPLLQAKRSSSSRRPSSDFIVSQLKKLQ